MKKCFPIIVSVFLLLSCASRRKSEGKNIDEITNIDFKKEAPIEYDRNEDYYDIFDSLGPIEDSLIEETIQRVASPDSNVEFNKGKDNQDNLSRLAATCYRNDFKDSIVIIDNLYRRYQKHSGYWNQVGNCYLLRGELRKANIFYKQAFKYNKNYAPAYNNIGNIHIQRREYEKALAAFKKAHELKRSALTPAYNLAQMYLNFGVVGQAQKLFLDIERQRPGDPSVLGGLAATYLFQGNVKTSLSYFRRISADNLERPSIGLNYAVVLALSGDKNSAIEVLNNVNNSSSEWKKYYFKVKSFVRQ